MARTSVTRMPDAWPSAGGKPMSRAEWRTILLASLGGALEYLDFILYGIFAGYIGRAFFPATDPLTSLILSFGVFAGGYLARPVGGFVLGHFGDRFGRRRILIWSILLMSISTMGMGLLPTYASIGAAASILMVVLRLMQGFALGGELPGAITYVVEAAPERKSLASGIIFLFVNSGVVLAALMSLIIHSVLGANDTAQWGWRIGFLAGGVLGFASFWLRLSLEESRAFNAIKQNASRLPILDLVQAHPGHVLTGIAALATMAGFNGLLFAHMPSYLTQVLGYPAFDAMLAQNICLATLSISLLAVAWAGDFIPRRYFLATGAALFVVLAWPFYASLAADRENYVWLMVGAAVVASLGNGTFAAIAADLFPTHLRLSGVASSLNLSTTIFSGTAPLVATGLIAVTGRSEAPAFVLIGCGILTLLSMAGLRSYLGPARTRLGR